MANVKKYRCMNVGNCKTANENKTFEIADGADKVCPDCKKDMIVEVKGGSKGLIFGGIAAGVVAAVAIGLFSTGVFSGKSDVAESVAVADTTVVVEETPVQTTDSVTVNEAEKTDTAVVVEEPAAEPQAAPATDKEVKQPAVSNYLNGYALPYGLYTGPAKNGRPHGPNGDIKVTKSYTLDLHNGNSLQLNPGDKISRCKFVDGKLSSGMLERPDKTAKQINIGVN
ncbi:hypothetical protein [Muribaculum intestinale]|uniref:Uncharacterized protein n=2 Tax=Muribaculum intestinale TaxID=1796646 RepID=A0A4S2FZG7_9BACT|nr:hypothetical protein [Muribaculum intestinale]MYM11805.1 hypothetical protein [Muribaculum intestinale]TGY74905.1 hypothetical protein E5333_05355 [Muribaculum intestinale]